MTSKDHARQDLLVAAGCSCAALDVDATAEMCRVIDAVAACDAAGWCAEDLDIGPMLGQEAGRKIMALGDPEAMATVIYAFGLAGFTCRFRDFCTYFDDLWYPSTDNICLRMANGDVLWIDHEEYVQRFTAERIRMVMEFQQHTPKQGTGINRWRPASPPPA